LLQEAEARLTELEKEREARNELAAKLEQLEKKLLVGGVNILDQHQQQQIILAKKAHELAEDVKRQQELEKDLKEKEEINIQIEEEYSNLQEEATSKTKKLKKLWNMCMEQKSELKDLKAEHQREREDLLETIRELTTEIKLKEAIICGFIPSTELEIICDCSEYDEAGEKWRIQHIAHAGNNIRGKISLVSGQVQPNDHQGLHRDHFSGTEAEAKLWDPMDAFPDPFLSYDVRGLKKKDNFRFLDLIILQV
jgi:kinesin family protein 3/17